MAYSARAVVTPLPRISRWWPTQRGRSSHRYRVLGVGVGGRDSWVVFPAGREHDRAAGVQVKVISSSCRMSRVNSRVMKGQTRRLPSSSPTTGPSSKSLATCCGTSCGSRTSRSSPQRSSHQSLPPQREGLWIRCGCAADGNFGPEVASCGTSARCNSPSPDLTDSDIRYVPPPRPLIGSDTPSSTRSSRTASRLVGVQSPLPHPRLLQGRSPARRV